jgi:hypothetical protein
MWKTAMPERSFAESILPEKQALPQIEMGWKGGWKIALLLLNALPLFHLATVVIGTSLIGGFSQKIIFLVTGLYLLPPFMVRMLLAIRSIQPGSYSMNSPEFLTWWATAQWQILFCRFPALEEILRIVPGLYSFWLRLWGAKIGRLTYWSPELRILDRSFVKIGNDVVFGVGVRLNPHVISNDENGRPLLHLGPVKIGDTCRIGGYSLLTAGTIVEPNQTLKAFSLSPPFTVWQKGRRTKGKKAAIPK